MFPPSEEIPATQIATAAGLNSPSKPSATSSLSPPASAITQLSLDSSQPAVLNLDAVMGDGEAIYRSPKRNVVRTFALDFSGLKESRSIDELVEVKDVPSALAAPEREELPSQNNAPADMKTDNNNFLESKAESRQHPQSPFQAELQKTFQAEPQQHQQQQHHQQQQEQQQFSPITAKHKSDEDLSMQQPLFKRTALVPESEGEEREVLSQNIDNDEGFYLSQPVQFSTQADDESPVKQQRELLVKTLSAEFEQKIASNPASPQKSPAKARAMSPVRLPVEEVSVTNSPQKSDDKMAKQIEFLQYEISSLQEKYESSLQTNAEMRAMVSEYERTLAQFIDARRSRPDQHSSVEELMRDKKKLELEIQTLQISFQNLHQRYEDIRGLHEQARINEATLKQSVQLLQQELAASIRNLDSTRKSYEERLEKLNMESLNCKSALENELSVTKAKLLKADLKISSLETAIEAKTKENSELMTICDELIHKMDRKS